MRVATLLSPGVRGAGPSELAGSAMRMSATDHVCFASFICAHGVFYLKAEILQQLLKSVV